MSCSKITFQAPNCIRVRHFIKKCTDKGNKEEELIQELELADLHFPDSGVVVIAANNGMWKLVTLLVARDAPTEGVTLQLLKKCCYKYPIVTQFLEILDYKISVSEAREMLKLCCTTYTIDGCGDLTRRLMELGHRPQLDFIKEYYDLTFARYLMETDKYFFQKAFDEYPEVGVTTFPAIGFMIGSGLKFNYNETMLKLIRFNADASTLDMLSRLIQLGADVNYKQGLAYAQSVYFKHDDIGALLVNAGADVSLSADTLYDMLRFGAGMVSALERCLNLKPDVNSSIEFLVDTLASTVFITWKQIVERLIDGHGLWPETIEKVIVASRLSINGYNIRTVIDFVQAHKLNPAMGNSFLLQKLLAYMPAEADLPYLKLLLDAGCQISEYDYEALMSIMPGSGKEIFRSYILEREGETMDRENPKVQRFLDLALESPAPKSRLRNIEILPDGILGDIPNRAAEDDHLYMVGSGSIEYIYAVFDGHGGRLRVKTPGPRAYMRQCNHIVYAAIYGGKIPSLGHCIETEIDKLEDPCIGVEEAIQRAFLYFDRLAYAAGCLAGTCVSMLISVAGQQYVVNLGDSRTIIYNQENGDILFETQDHDAKDPAEVARVLAAGGKVVGGRINQSLMVFRSLGDYKFKFNGNRLHDPVNGAASAVPVVTRLTVPSGVSARAIITSDAPYSFGTDLSNQDVVEVVRSCRTAQQAALFIAPYTEDDLTIISVDV